MPVNPYGSGKGPNGNKSRNQRTVTHFMVTPFLAKHASLGIFVALFFLVVLVFFDVGGVGGMIRDSEMNMLVGSLVTGVFAFTFASIQVCYALLFRSHEIERRVIKQQRLPSDGSIHRSVRQTKTRDLYGMAVSEEDDQSNDRSGR
ncbi:MAG: hypothetical protein AAGH60_09570 [Pseudomonadota bacterium]